MVGLVVGRFEKVRFEHRKRSTAAIVDAAGRTGMRMWLEHEHPAIAGAAVAWRGCCRVRRRARDRRHRADVSDELLRLPYAIRLARATLRNVRMNVAISLALKAAFLVMAFTGTATLWMAVLADTGASVIVVGNALRLLRAR